MNQTINILEITVTEATLSREVRYFHDQLLLSLFILVEIALKLPTYLSSETSLAHK